MATLERSNVLEGSKGVRTKEHFTFTTPFARPFCAPIRVRRWGFLMSDDPAASRFRATAGNLLFGLLALQNSFISRHALVAAFGAWVADKSKPLDRILLDQGHLDA